MLGQFGLLGLLKGWEYKEHSITRVLNRDQSDEILIGEMGWLLQITELTNDSLGTIGIQYQGADLETHYVELSPDTALPYGSFMPDPSGYIIRYFRPNPNSTAGIYVLALNLTGYFGAAWPYVPTIKMRAKLGQQSTQTSATVSAYAGTIAITNKETFLRSLRLALQSKADLGIDLGLLSVGPAELGKAEKKGSS